MTFNSDNFWALTKQEDDCLIWTGATNKDPLYGVYIAFGGRLIAHRVAYELSHGTIPPRAHIGRICKNPLCVKPEHLFLHNSSRSLIPTDEEKKRFSAQLDDSGGENACWIWKGKMPKVIKLSTGIRIVSRAIYELYNGPILAGREVRRSCNNFDCLNPKHLVLVDKAQLGKSNAKLTLEQVKEIRRLSLTGEVGLSELAEKYHTSRQTIYTVVYNLGWHDESYTPPEKMPRRPRFCRKGHRLIPETIVVLPNGARKCKLCMEIALATKPKRKTLAERFWDKVNKGNSDDVNACWLWTAYTYNGWGYIGLGRSPHLVHRVSWELANGPVPEGFNVLHSCTTRNCVRPEHLYLDKKEEKVIKRPNKEKGTGGVAATKILRVPTSTLQRDEGCRTF